MSANFTFSFYARMFQEFIILPQQIRNKFIETISDLKYTNSSKQQKERRFCFFFSKRKKISCNETMFKIKYGALVVCILID